MVEGHILALTQWERARSISEMEVELSDRTKRGRSQSSSRGAHPLVRVLVGGSDPISWLSFLVGLSM